MISRISNGKVEELTWEERDRFKAALERIKALDEDPSLHANNPRECAICYARDALEKQPDWVLKSQSSKRCECDAFSQAPCAQCSLSESKPK
jgi:hypothetical protein